MPSADCDGGAANERPMSSSHIFLNREITDIQTDVLEKYWGGLVEIGGASFQQGWVKLRRVLNGRSGDPVKSNTFMAMPLGAVCETALWGEDTHFHGLELVIDNVVHYFITNLPWG